MRPLRLELEGFGSFRDPTTVDLDGAELFVLSGPTGAGKSTIIDGVTFALYGTIARLDDRRLVEAVISRGRNEARVRLTFEARGATYTATRVVRKDARGRTSTKEARLEGAGGEVHAGSVRDLDDQVERLVGLSFEHFTRCVVLPQGAFQAFLHAKGNDRQQLLSSLLRLGIYDDLASRARQQAKEAGFRVQAATTQLEGRLADATEAALAEATARRDALAALVARLRDEAAHEEEILDAGRSAAARRDAARADVARLGALAAPADLADTAGELAALTARSAAAATALTAARTDLEAARAAAEGLPRGTDVQARVQQLAELGARRQALADVTDETATAVAAVAAATTAAEQAVASVGEAAAALTAAEVEHRAAALAAHLEVGAPCPVCHQDVAVLPEHAAGVLDDARATVAAAETSRARADRALRDAQQTRDRLTARAESVDDEVERLAAAVAASALPDDGTALAALAERIAATAREVTAAGQAMSAAEREVAAAEQASAAVTRRRDEAWAAVATARDTVADLQPPPIDRGADADLAAAWQALLAWRESPLAQATQRANEADAERDRQAAAYKALTAAQQAAAASLGVTLAAGERPLDAVTAAHARSDTRLATLAADLDEAARLRGLVATERADLDLLRALGTQLDAKHFQQWLLQRALRRVVGGATAILRDLSQGAYSLAITPTGEFEVIDHANADDHRSVRTLSGGETFLASLALALSLSDHVVELAAEGASQLDTLFIDEGFGTLDAETLQVVGSALHELAADGRVVGLVTHVEELARLVPTRFEVRKVGNTSSVTRVEAA